MSYLLCCPLLDPQIAGTGELPPDTINWDGEKKIIAKMIKPQYLHSSVVPNDVFTVNFFK